MKRPAETLQSHLTGQISGDIPSVSSQSSEDKIQYGREVSFASPAAGCWSWVGPADPQPTNLRLHFRPSGFNVRAETFIVPFDDPPSVHVSTRLSVN